MVDVRLRSGQQLRLHQRRVAAASLRPGLPLDRPELDRLQRCAEVDRCEQRALRLIGVRARSRSELERRFAQWGLTEAEADEIAGRLQRLGLLDDRALAAATGERLRRAGQGSRRVDYDLGRLGVADRLRMAEVDEHRDGELDRARAALAGRFGDPPYAPAVQRRAFGFLARRGFDEEIVMEAIGAESG